MIDKILFEGCLLLSIQRQNHNQKTVQNNPPDEGL